MEMREQLAEILRPHAIVIETSARDEALTWSRALSLDAAFIDIDRTEHDGFSIAARLRRTTARRLRLIAVSNANTRSDIGAFREAGFDLRVAWPIKPEQVIAALNTILRTSN